MIPTTIEPTKDFSRVVGIRDARRGGLPLLIILACLLVLPASFWCGMSNPANRRGRMRIN
jgi:hypothetical protein